MALRWRGGEEVFRQEHQPRSWSAQHHGELLHQPRRLGPSPASPPLPLHRLWGWGSWLAQRWGCAHQEEHLQSV